MTKREKAGVGALAFIALVTVAWWALALWPVAGAGPEWLARARAVCFNAGGDGLPDPSGWLLLIGQPLGMTAVLMVGWGRAVKAGLRRLGRSLAGRAALGGAAAVLLVGLGLAGVRVAQAREAAVVQLPGEELPPSTYPRLDRPAPVTALTDQHGQPFRLDQLRGGPALVTFAFGHCRTVCPLVVEGAKEARRRLLEAGPGGQAPPPVVVLTLDPWRDTPARLGHLAEKWGLGPEDRVLSGGVEHVNAVLDAWRMTRRRDPATGDIAHPALVYVLDAEGRIAFAAPGRPVTLVELLLRL